MKIDYLCISVPNLYSDDYTINEDDDENTVWIKTKDKELMNTAAQNEILMLFDRSSKKFYINNKEADVKGMVIFPRSFIPYSEELLTELEKQGAISIQTNDQSKKIEKWPQFIQPVHRKIIQTTYEEFQNHNEEYKLKFNHIFLKTVKKSNIHCTLKYYGFLDFEGKKIFFTKPAFFNLKLDDEIIISETFKSIEDPENNMGCKEYRAFVLNNKLLSLSRSYVDYPTPISDNVVAFVEEQIKKVSYLDFPSSYVLDVGEILVNDKEVVDIIEYNPICSSGLEVSNNLVYEIIKENQNSNSFVKKLKL